jgi:hypothetical protein
MRRCENIETSLLKSDMPRNFAPQQRQSKALMEQDNSVSPK